MSADIELVEMEENINSDYDGNVRDELFKSDYHYLIFSECIKLYKNGNSVLLELLSCTSIAGFKNATETTINIGKISYMNVTKSSALTKVGFWLMTLIMFVLISLSILAECAEDFESAGELIVAYWIFLVISAIIYVPFIAIAYYYVSLEYLVLYSDNGSKIKINTKKVINYFELTDLLKKLI